MVSILVCEMASSWPQVLHGPEQDIRVHSADRCEAGHLWRCSNFEHGPLKRSAEQKFRDQNTRHNDSWQTNVILNKFNMKPYPSPSMGPSLVGSFGVPWIFQGHFLHASLRMEPGVVGEGLGRRRFALCGSHLVGTTGLCSRTAGWHCSTLCGAQVGFCWDGSSQVVVVWNRYLFIPKNIK